MRIAGASERVVIMLLGLGAVGGASGQITPVQQAKIKASDASSKDSFGSSIAVWGDTAVVGAEHHDLSIESPLDEGAAYVFVRSDTAWTQQAQLVASDAAAADAFGHAVAVWGDTVAVGAWRDDHGGDADAGSVHVFVRNGTVWSEQAKLTAIDASMGDQFGRAVAMAGDTLVVGAPGDDPHGTTDAGSVHVFVRNGTAWKQQVRLAASDGAADDAFGCSVAVCDDTVVIGAVGSDPSDVFNAGAAYVFVRNGALWTEQAKLTTYHADAWDHLGVSVGVSGDTAVVGAKNADMHPAPDCGAACTYVRSGTTWTQQARLTASDATYSDGFGISVAVSGDTVVVGASEDDIGPTAKDAGSAYVFVRGASGWMEQAHLIAHNSMEGDRFGAAIAVWGDTALVGGPQDDHVGGIEAGSGWVFTVGGFTDLGDGWPGDGGIPELTGTGTLVVGSDGSLALDNASPSTLSALVMSLADTPSPFKSGTLHAVPVLSMLMSATSPAGTWTQSWKHWPAGLPAGMKLCFQSIVPDPGATQGYALSNALQALQP